MDLPTLFQTLIYVISSSLIYPVLILLNLLVVVMVIYAGTLTAEWVGRGRRSIFDPVDLGRIITSSDSEKYLSPQPARYVAELNKATQSGRRFSGAEVENLLRHRVERLLLSIDRLKILVRIGPGLGLMGTLIPMGTGLASLGNGEMETLASNLVVAFTTTVVGLAIGLLSYVFLTLKQRWVEADIRLMEAATDIIMGEK